MSLWGIATVSKRIVLIVGIAVFLTVEALAAVTAHMATLWDELKHLLHRGQGRHASPGRAALSCHAAGTVIVVGFRVDAGGWGVALRQSPRAGGTEGAAVDPLLLQRGFQRQRLLTCGNGTCISKSEYLTANTDPPNSHF